MEVVNGKWVARECGNCHNILWISPVEATDQVFDREGFVSCSCGAPTFGRLLQGEWTS